MANISLKNVSKTYNNKVNALVDFSLEVEHKEFIVLVGPSGCGKSTVLQIISGLEDDIEGEVWIDDKMVNDIAPKDRDIAMVFQNYSLYPYMTVYDNMAFGLKIRKFRRDEIKEKVLKAAELLELTDLLNRKPKELSGGQRQRVAIGRALVRDPKVFLMDEPLSNLDSKLRNTLRREIIKLHRNMDSTFIYVTHDQIEAMTLGTRIVVLNKGVIQQVGTPQELYETPKNKFVAGFIGSPQMNFIKTKCVIMDNKVVLTINDSYISLSKEQGIILKEKNYINKEIIIGIRPENIYEGIEIEMKHPDNVIREVIENYEMTGSEVYIYIRLNNEEVVFKTDVHTTLKRDDIANLVIDPYKIHLFDLETENRIES